MDKKFYEVNIRDGKTADVIHSIKVASTTNHVGIMLKAKMIARDKLDFIFNVKHHRISYTELDNTSGKYTECENCGGVYDTVALKRSQGAVFWLYKYCSAVCYTIAVGDALSADKAPVYEHSISVSFTIESNIEDPSEFSAGAIKQKLRELLKEDDSEFITRIESFATIEL